MFKKLQKSIISAVLAVALLLCLSTLGFAKSDDFNAKNVISYAKQFVGCPYVHGAHGPNAFDCSGFVFFVFEHFGFKLSTSSSDYYSTPESFGETIDEKDAKPGDIISWAGHVGIFLGKGKVIHALNSRTGVCVNEISQFRNRYGATNPPHHFIRVNKKAEKTNISSAQNPNSYQIPDGEYIITSGKMTVCEKNGNLCLEKANSNDPQSWIVANKNGKVILKSTKTHRIWAAEETAGNAILTKSKGSELSEISVFGSKSKVYFFFGGGFLGIDDGGLNLNVSSPNAKSAAKFKLQRLDLLNLDEKYQPIFLSESKSNPLAI